LATISAPLIAPKAGDPGVKAVEHFDQRIHLANLAAIVSMIVVTDSIYERLSYDGAHELFAAYPGMRERTVLLGGFSKSYSSLLAFIALPTWLKEHLKVAAAPYLYSGPSPIASLATTLAGLDVNEERGDAIRADLWRKTSTVLECLDRLGAHTPNRSGFPIIEVPLAHHEEIDAVGRFLFEEGVYITLAAYPLVPRDEVGFRIQVTAANTDAEIEHLVDVLGRLTNRFDLQPALTRRRVA